MKVDNKKSFLVYTAILVSSLVLINLISRNVFKRFDLTDTQMYSLSSSSKSVISKIDDLMTIKVYFSKDLPGNYANNRRYLQDILEEYVAYSKGNLRFEFMDPSSDENMQLTAQQSGIQPVQLQVIENDKVEVKRVYMGLSILYQDNKEIIPVIQNTYGLEYNITTKIKKLVDTEKQTIAIASSSLQTPQNESVTPIFRERYALKTIKLEETIDSSISTLIINGLEDSLNSNEYQNLKNYIDNGGNLLMGQGRVSVDIQTQQAKPINSNIFSLLEEYGVNIEENLVLDKACGKVNVQQNMGIFRMAVPMDYPFIPVIKNFNSNEIIVSGIEQHQVLFPSEIRIDTLVSSYTTLFPLLTSSNRSTTMSGAYNLNPDPKANPFFSKLNESGKIIAVRSEINNPANDLPNNIILISDSKFISDNGSGGIAENHIFLLNAIDYLMGDSELISLRSREITTRPLQELENSTKSTWKWINMIVPSIIILSFGFLRLRREKNRSKQLENIYA